ncbi:hypothetical protein M9194_04865 [Vibrio sp. S4M6]|uniref:hypothetical protein n=1 Tax=Vibrio sinus TaxID=2946865 RepID=UPI002029DD2E|nr:hypothetical protein [Vibrio sinus]MCL9780769.1 hypothetical protein [Vibrio sinus]
MNNKNHKVFSIQQGIEFVQTHHHTCVCQTNDKDLELKLNASHFDVITTGQGEHPWAVLDSDILPSHLHQRLFNETEDGHHPLAADHWGIYSAILDAFEKKITRPTILKVKTTHNSDFLSLASFLAQHLKRPLLIVVTILDEKARHTHVHIDTLKQWLSAGCYLTVLKYLQKQKLHNKNSHSVTDDYYWLLARILLVQGKPTSSKIVLKHAQRLSSSPDKQILYRRFQLVLARKANDANVLESHIETLQHDISHALGDTKDWLKLDLALATSLSPQFSQLHRRTLDSITNAPHQVMPQCLTAALIWSAGINFFQQKNLNHCITLLEKATQRLSQDYDLVRRAYLNFKLGLCLGMAHQAGPAAQQLKKTAHEFILMGQPNTASLCYAEACRHYIKAERLNEAKESYGLLHNQNGGFNALLSMRCLAQLYLADSQLQLAASQCEKALDIISKLFPPQSPIRSRLTVEFLIIRLQCIDNKVDPKLAQQLLQSIQQLLSCCDEQDQWLLNRQLEDVIEGENSKNVALI